MKKVDGVIWIGAALVALLVVFLGGYQAVAVVPQGPDPVYGTETAREQTLDGYEEPEAVVAYVIRQMQQGDYDLAVRGCAVEEVAEYFSLIAYLKEMDEFAYTEMIPSADYDDETYIDITKARMASEYISLLEQFAGQALDGHELVLFDIVENVPENPDGMYYQTRSKICEILGCRNVEEMIAYVTIDGEPKEIHFSLAQYRRFWKVILITTLDRYENLGPDIRETSWSPEGLEPWDYSDQEGDILPANCYIVNDDSEETPEKLVHDFALYLQRGDLRSAMSYFNLYESIVPGILDRDAVKKQGETAKTIQKFYYDIYLHDENELAWIYRHLSDEPDYLMSELRMSNMIFASFDDPTFLEEKDGKSVYQIGCYYDKSYFVVNLELIYKSGWKVDTMSWGKVW